MFRVLAATQLGQQQGEIDRLTAYDTKMSETPTRTPTGVGVGQPGSAAPAVAADGGGYGSAVIACTPVATAPVASCVRRLMRV